MLFLILKSPCALGLCTALAMKAKTILGCCLESVLIKQHFYALPLSNNALVQRKEKS